MGGCRGRDSWVPQAIVVRVTFQKASHLKRAVGIIVIMDREAELLHVVGALDSAGCLAGGLHGGKQQRDQHSDDCDDDEELN